MEIDAFLLGYCWGYCLFQKTNIFFFLNTTNNRNNKNNYSKGRRNGNIRNVNDIGNDDDEIESQCADHM